MSKKVVIVGGGFGGLEAAKALGRSGKLRITVLDRRNHFLFQPLLYQIATADLGPSDIAAPIRQILARHPSIQVHLETVVSVDLDNRLVHTEADNHPYDYLILACGSTHSYFGRNEWEERAPGLKTIEQALEIRRRLLLAFEEAEKEVDAAAQARLLTFVIVGGGPTGVELAGAVAELGRAIAGEEFHNIRPEQVRTVLLQAGERLIPGFSPSLSERARRALERKGVEVRLGVRAEEMGPEGVRAGGESIPASTVMWAAGVRPSALNATLGVPLARDGRLPVEPDMSLPGFPDVFAVGDQARFETPGGPLPGLAPVAMQQGRAAARNILRDLAGRPRKPFRYVDKGSMAVIGRAYAVAEMGRIRISGFPAWLAWIFVHILYLVGHRSRILVMFNWAWSYFTRKRGARLITFQGWKESDAPRVAGPSAGRRRTEGRKA
jgi:NADH dehydrogenase